MLPSGFTADQTALLAFELAIYVSVRAGVPESVVEARVSDEERVTIIEDVLSRSSITDPRDLRARSRDVFDSAAERVEVLLVAAAA
jgi:hypothetical protein